MPLLKFKCEGCGHVFEELTTSDKKVACPKCASANTNRHYQGRCSFGSRGGKGGGGCGGGSCGGCSGCQSG
jgi:putative regulatory protein, FmdB family